MESGGVAWGAKWTPVDPSMQFPLLLLWGCWNLDHILGSHADLLKLLGSWLPCLSLSLKWTQGIVASSAGFQKGLERLVFTGVGQFTQHTPFPGNS